MTIFTQIFLILFWILILINIYKKYKTKRIFDHTAAILIVTLIGRVVNLIFIKNATANQYFNIATLIIVIFITYLTVTKKAFI